MKKLIARFVTRLSVILNGYENFLKVFATDFAKTTFSDVVIIRGVISSASFPAGKEVKEHGAPEQRKQRAYL